MHTARTRSNHYAPENGLLVQRQVGVVVEHLEVGSVARVRRMDVLERQVHEKRVFRLAGRHTVQKFLERVRVCVCVCVLSLIHI